MPKYMERWTDLRVTIESKTLIDALCQLDRRDLLDLIKEVDASKGEWDFTLDLCDHFAKLKVEHEKESKEFWNKEVK